MLVFDFISLYLRAFFERLLVYTLGLGPSGVYSDFLIVSGVYLIRVSGFISLISGFICYLNRIPSISG